ncbi:MULTISPECIES: Smr/MutS family protein [unclassified Mesorhizobium]|uniref:Smr/MutS family protein n=1 Tax=unclassified Mesorhizobium TaxID=325217 RepID=UPI000BB025C0|nr:MULTISPECIES: Smr/MutS family protein [unclassified Mesorhizobium]TGT60397.1 DNA mismatch repair protein MutS [Mesorhizobium sp. M00.F.Ca.ET.170.01.1.1]AZO10498.1 DNA mismatch repair protein MutS [Mesorhizobium sp. M3A.F.Ca.ET.080.04.2.1]PBB88033.1 DNA mismatch repair protein MutS [Mesorhizobium sp. WSM3876]RWB69155.1 MAG: DNA mismatch repair protein MutS [Mesorhizobium sp.]RWB84196.1 MAG: DNA mismatch repair protein MutS [Mesorhizobium sp.]
MTRRDDKLSEDDRILWNLVARTARPLKGKAAVEIPDLVKPNATPEPPPVNGVPAIAAKPKVQHVAHALDDQTLHKLKKGRLPIEGRVDLHGMTQDEAYSLLLTFLHRAHAGGIRYVLVITGKGSSSGGDGILRRSVPHWLSTPAFRHLVSSHDHAARNHGGSGALYVRLRRTRA